MLWKGYACLGIDGLSTNVLECRGMPMNVLSNTKWYHGAEECHKLSKNLTEYRETQSKRRKTLWVATKCKKCPKCHGMPPNPQKCREQPRNIEEFRGLLGNVLGAAEYRSMPPNVAGYRGHRRMFPNVDEFGGMPTTPGNARGIL